MTEAAQEKFELGPIQKEWLRRLRAHPERQLKTQLGVIKDLKAGEYKACCLGEAVLLLCELDGKRPKISPAGSLIDGSGSFYPSDNAVDRLGLYDDHGSLKLGCGFQHAGEYMNALAVMNDKGMTWPEIAAYIEANPENVFTKSV